MVECYLVSNLPLQATTVVYDLFDSVGRDHLEKKIIEYLIL